MQKRKFSYGVGQNQQRNQKTVDVCGLVFFSEDELRRAGITESADDCDVRPLDAMACANIAKLFPPQFVRNKQKFTLANWSLSPAAFHQILAGTGYHNLMNFAT